MPATRKSVPGEKIAEARHLYERTLVPMWEIAALLGISGRTLQRRAHEWDWKRRQQGGIEVTRLRRDNSGRTRVVRQATPRKQAGEAPQSPAERMALVERIQAVAEREIAAVEQIIAIIGPVDKNETEGAARTLASLARTLRELQQLDVPPSNPQSADDRPIPRDLDELRRSLARKLAALAAGEADSLPELP